VGDYGNSGLTIGADGTIAEMKATSNTPLSPKLLITGRTIALYQAEQNASRGDRYELRRPRLDFDINFVIRMNDDLRARILTNVHNEADNVGFWETRLNLDRGHLWLDNATITGALWENEGLIRFDDPLRLVGDVGIYDHTFGFNTVGAMARRTVEKVDIQVLLADDRDPGGESGGVLDEEGARAFLAGEAVEEADGEGLQFGAGRTSYTPVVSGDSEDVLAARARRPMGTFLEADWTLGASWRFDHSFNPGTLAESVPGTSDTVGTARLYPETSERWQAFGADLVVAAGPLALSFEYLRGDIEVDAGGGGSRLPATLEREPDAEGNPVISLGEGTPIDGKTFSLGGSDRFFAGARWPNVVLGIDGQLSLTYQDRDFAPIETALGRTFENSLL